MKYTYPTLDKFYIKVLDFFNKYPNSTLKELYSIGFPDKPYGNCIDEINALRSDQLIVLSGKKKRAMTFILSDKGRKLLDIAYSYTDISQILDILKEFNETYPVFQINATLHGLDVDLEFFKNMLSMKKNDDPIKRHLANKILKYSSHWDELKSVA